ncbi:MAG: ribonuclease T [Pseudomonadales bacterium]
MNDNDDFELTSDADEKLKSPLARRFRGFLPVVLDVETGGFNCATDAVLEVAALTVTMDEDGYLLEDRVYSANVQPFKGANLEPSALEFTGIDPHDPARDAKSEDDAFRQLFQMVRKAIKAHGCTRAIIVAHNATFDHGFVNAASDRCGLKRNPFHPFSTFDTACLAGLAYGQTVLARACEEAGIEFDNASAHSALYDAQKTSELFCQIVNRWRDLGGWLDSGP